jgi:outer membrane lipoprotein-sorting protein
VSSLRLTGEMDVGQGMLVPYVLEQKRPGKMRLELVFDGETAVQSYDGQAGWKLVPFRGRTQPEPMTEAELREAAGPADLDGLLFDYAAKGSRVELLGRETVQGRDAFKLRVELSGGAVRWVYLDAESALEVKVEATKAVGRREQTVETFYFDWQEVEGLLVPYRYETRAEGAPAQHLLTVETVRVNPTLDDSRFAMPAAIPAAAGRGN